MNVLEKIRSIHAGLASGSGRADDWALLGRLLSRLTSDGPRLERLVSSRDHAGVGALLEEIEGRHAAAQAAPTPSFSPDELARALKAFLKQLKVSRLADESKLGGRYTSGGRTSNIDAMKPPGDFPDGIWQALVREGKLKDRGGGFFGEA